MGFPCGRGSSSKGSASEHSKGPGQVRSLKPFAAQKSAQRTAAQLQDLLEICCFWTQISGDIGSYFGEGPEVRKIEDMFVQGPRVCIKTVYFFDVAPSFKLYIDFKIPRYSLFMGRGGEAQMAFRIHWHVMPGLFQDLAFIHSNLNSTVFFWIWPEGQVCTLFLADPTYGGLKKNASFRVCRLWSRIPQYSELAENSAVLGVGRKFRGTRSWPLAENSTTVGVESWSSFIESHDLMSLKCGSELRTLDTELRAHCRAMAGDFDYKKLSFVLEGKGLLEDQQLEAAQSRANNALHKSQALAFELFKTQLEQDQIARRRYLSSTAGDETRARAAIIESLEDL